MKFGMVYKCPVCDKHYWTQPQRNKHMKKVHPGAPIPPLLPVSQPVKPT